MGFGDFLKKAGEIVLEVGKEVGKAAIDKSKQISELKKDLQSETDEVLLHLYKHGKTEEKAASSILLKDRGYTHEDIQSMSKYLS